MSKNGDAEEEDYMSMAIPEPVQPMKETSIQRRARKEREVFFNLERLKTSFAEQNSRVAKKANSNLRRNLKSKPPLPARPV